MIEGGRNLAKAVIVQAFKDACKTKDSYVRRSARNFLCAKNDLWLESLKTWCDAGEVDYNRIIFLSRKRFNYGRTTKTTEC